MLHEKQMRLGTASRDAEIAALRERLSDADRLVAEAEARLKEAEAAATAAAAAAAAAGRPRPGTNVACQANIKPPLDREPTEVPPSPPPARTQMTLTAVEKRPPKQVQVNYKTPDYNAEYDDFFARLNWYVMCNSRPSAACKLGFVSVLRNLLLRVCFLLPMCAFSFLAASDYGAIFLLFVKTVFFFFAGTQRKS
jgi:hypothetical protein